MNKLRYMYKLQTTYKDREGFDDNINETTKIISLLGYNVVAFMCEPEPFGMSPSCKIVYIVYEVPVGEDPISEEEMQEYIEEYRTNGVISVAEGEKNRKPRYVYKIDTTYGQLDSFQEKINKAIQAISILGCNILNFFTFKWAGMGAGLVIYHEVYIVYERDEGKPPLEEKEIKKTINKMEKQM